MDELKGYLHDIAKEFSSTGWVDDNCRWVQLYPYGSWTHPLFSDTTIDKVVAEKLVKNFNENVMGRELVVEYDHGLDKAKGGKAAGTVIKEEARDDGLFGLVKFNDVAKAEIENGEWRYMSNSHYDSWTNPQTGETIEFVPENPSLTNRPYVRGMSPINFSDIVVEHGEKKEFAVWSTAYVDALPDSAFLWIDASGKRHLPYKDSTGKIDLAHLRNAIARIPQMTGGDHAALQAKARAILAKQHSDAVILADPTASEYAELIGLLDEGGETVVTDEEFQTALREKLGLGADVDLLAHIIGINDEVGPLRELKKEHSDRKTFSELYPDQAAELERLRVSERENFAKQFSDNLATARVVRKTKADDSDEVVSTPTGLGFSALVLEKITEQVKEYSDGKATLEGFKGVLDAITDDGIVDYGVHGSERTTDIDDEERKNKAPKDFSDARKQFSDVITKIQEDDKVDFNAAYAIAAKKHPELFEAYKTKKPVVTAST